MSEFDVTEDLEPDDGPDAEEFEGTDEGVDSAETGTHYDSRGEAEATPHDYEDAGEDEE